MKGRDFCQEKMAPLDIRRVFVTDLLLLGFDKVAAVARLPFNMNMFDVPNKSAFEIVMHFLFKKLNPTRCHEHFRDCWPIGDRKQEQLFRRACMIWLTEISESDPNAHLPRIVASLFLSPGGGKLCQFLFCFTRYVLLKVTRNEYGRKSILHHPMLTPDCIHLGDLVETVVQANTVRYRQKFFNRLQESALVQKEWQHYSSVLVKDHRHLCQLEREKDKESSSLQQAAVDRGSPIPLKRRSGGMADYDLDVQTVRRTQRIQKLRSQWKVLCDYYHGSQQERDIIQSILQGIADKHKIDASSIDFKVPEMLLREFDREIQAGAVSNTYEGGNLNLLSVIQLWNLSLHLYIEKIQEVGTPDLKDVGPRIRGHMRTHNAHLGDLRVLETKLKNDVIPNIKESIADLQTQLDQTTHTFRAMSSPGAKSSFHELGLMPPTPPVRFAGTPVDSTAVPARPLRKTSRTSEESTPEAVTRLMSSIRKERHSPLIQGSPIFSARTTNTANTFHHSKLPVHILESSEEKPIEGRVRQRSAPSKVTSTVKTPSKGPISARGHLTAQVKRVKPAVTREKFSSTSSVFTTPTTPDRKEMSVFSSLKMTQTPGSSSRERAESILVDKIVESIMANSPDLAMALSRESTPKDNNDVNLKDPMAALQECAFEVRDKIARSPLDARTPLPKIDLDTSNESSQSPPRPPHKLLEQETLLEKFEEAAYSNDEAEVDALDVLDTNNNNSYIGGQEKLEEIFRQSPGFEEEEKRLEELLSFSMKMDSSYNPFPEVDDDTVTNSAKKSSKDKNNSLRNGHLSLSTRKVHFSDSCDNVDNTHQKEASSSSDVSPVSANGGLLGSQLEEANTLHVLGGLKKFSLDDDFLSGFEDIVVGGEVLNGEERIDELRQNEGLLSTHQESEEHGKFGRDTSAIEVPLINIKTGSSIRFTPSAATSYRSPSKFLTIHSNLLNESVEDLNDVSLGDMAAPDDFELDEGAFSPPQATSPTEYETDHIHNLLIGSPQHAEPARDSKLDYRSNGLIGSTEEPFDDLIGDFRSIVVPATPQELHDDVNERSKLNSSTRYRSNLLLGSPDDLAEDAKLDSATGIRNDLLSGSPSGLFLDPAEDSKLSSATGISSDLLMRFRKLKLSIVDPVGLPTVDEVPSLSMHDTSVNQDESGLDMMYLTQSPRPKVDEEKKFTLDLAFESDDEEEEKEKEAKVENVFWSPDPKIRFKSRLDDMLLLGEDASILVPPSP